MFLSKKLLVSLLVLWLAILIISRRPLVVESSSRLVCKSVTFIPTSSSDMMSGLCRKVLVEHQDITTSVYDCGPSNATEVVMMLHGFPDNVKTFKKQIEPLANAGYRMLIPKMRGYELSSQKPTDYHISQLAVDAICVADAFDVHEFHILGHDWGAITAQTLGIYYPNEIKSIVSIAVPPQLMRDNALWYHPSQILNSWYMFFFQIPFLPEFLISKGYVIEYLVKSWSPTYDWDSDPHLKEILDTFIFSYSSQTTIQYYRENIPNFIEASIERVLQGGQKAHFLYTNHPLFGVVQNIDTLLVTGASDGCIKTEFYDLPVSQIFTKPSKVSLKRLPGGHFVHYENPEQFNQELLQFYQRITNQSSTNNQVHQ